MNYSGKISFITKIPSVLGKMRQNSKLAWWCLKSTKVIIILDKARVIEISEKEIRLI